jgi:hypothetical protein
MLARYPRWTYIQDLLALLDVRVFPYAPGLWFVGQCVFPYAPELWFVGLCVASKMAMELTGEIHEVVTKFAEEKKRKLAEEDQKLATVKCAEDMQ